MPCRSDYMEPTQHEIYCKRTAKLYAFALSRLGLSVTSTVKGESENVYASVDYTKDLCSTLGELRQRDPAAFDELVYNAKDQQSRKLADWWEDHEKVDRKRIAAEKAEEARQALVKSGIAKLTPEEIKALGIKS